MPTVFRVPNLEEDIQLESKLGSVFLLQCSVNDLQAWCVLILLPLRRKWR